MNHHQIFVNNVLSEIPIGIPVWKAEQLTENQSLFDSSGSRAVILSCDLKGLTQFYWVDLEPDANWDHRAMYVAIDGEGMIHKKGAFSPPNNAIIFKELKRGEE